MKLSRIDRLAAWFQDRGIIVELHEAQPAWPYVVAVHLDHGPRNRHVGWVYGFGQTLEVALIDLRERTQTELDARAADDDRTDPETRAERGERMWEEQRDRDLDKGAA